MPGAHSEGFCDSQALTMESHAYATLFIIAGWHI